MNRHDDNQNNRQGLKRKLTVALVMLLISSILMGTTSYAWFVLSTAPEVTGINTNIGANGSLEIALLNTETRQNLSAIRTSYGKSLQTGIDGSANNSWGNLLDLGYTQYGLNEIVLLPARLSMNTDHTKLNSGMLAVPQYGYDGRVLGVEDNSFTGSFSTEEDAFVFEGGAQGYGVRAIGTSNTMTAQSSALAMAKSNIATYTKNANSQAAATLDSNGDDLFSIMITHATNGGATHTEADLNTIKNMVSGLQSASDYIEQALRQGIIAVGAKELEDEDQFLAFRNTVNNAGSLNDLMANLGSNANKVPSSFKTMIEDHAEIEAKLNEASNACSALKGGSYSWEQIKSALTPLINTDLIYIGETAYPDFDAGSATKLIGGSVELRLAPGSGVFADIADFADDYDSELAVMGTQVTILTRTAKDPVYLVALRNEVDGYTPAGGDAVDSAALDTTYGYALDLAFRSNSSQTNLLLQTSGEQRVYDGSNAASTLGGGSYMEFSFEESDFTLKQASKLMDSVRVAFVDDQDNILGIAKLNTSNRTTSGSKVKAPLYLYSYEWDEEGALIMGERKKEANLITPLIQNTAKAVTVIVWLDGDIVDNTMVNAESSTSLSGVLNLQFASSANLVPAEYAELLYFEASKSGLQTAVDNVKTIYDAGRGNYTNESWKAFVAAYTYAETLLEEGNPSEVSMKTAAYQLTLAKNDLTTVSVEALNEKIAEVRALMGEIDSEIARYVVEDKNGNYIALGEYTNDQIAGNKGTIKAVDYLGMNLVDAVNDAQTARYSEASWNALAAVLYEAEAVAMDPTPDDEVVDAALEALTNAKDALKREIYFTAYEMNGALYYKATSLEDKDAYGKWFDGEFKMITSEILILDLDADAKIANIAGFADEYFYRDAVERFNPTIVLNNALYPELGNDSILGVHWNTPKMFKAGLTNATRAQLNFLISEAVRLEVVDSIIQNARDVLAANNDPAAAAAAITALSEAIDPLVEEETTAAYDRAKYTQMLEAAVASAKSVAGYEDATKTELADLRTATATAEDLLARGFTNETAQGAINALNTQLTKYEKTAITENNTVVHVIPTDSKSEIVYACDFASITYLPTGELGDDTISAWILTENGVIYEVKELVSIYKAASGASITGSQTVTVGGKTELTAALTGEGQTETIKSCTWSSDKTAVVTVSGDAEKVNVTGVAAGTATIRVTVETIQGNEYTFSYEVTCG